MSQPDSLRGDEWSKKTARKVLPLLVAYAHAARPITYGELSRETTQRKWSHDVMPLAYRYVAGAIGFSLEETEEEWDEPIPPINALIVNDNTGLPGKGVDTFLKAYLRQTGSKVKLTAAQRQSIIEEIHKDIYNYSNWGKLLSHYNLKKPPKLRNGGKKKKQTSYNWSNEGESQEHKNLKRYIATHPESIGLPSNSESTEEFLLPSADKVDVHFQSEGWDVAVEVKSVKSNDDDLRRGVFQCVKYREVLRALRRTEGEIPQVKSLLVVERPLPSELVDIATTLKVRCVVVNLTKRIQQTQ